MTISISREQARRLLSTYHFRPTTIAGVFERLGTVQYDPLNPVGRNADLVLQARVSDYHVDDWQHSAYTQRLVYDSWDKQACLVPVEDWPHRALIRSHHRPYHDREVLQQHADVARAMLALIDSQGPLSSQDFADRTKMMDGNSWYGETLARRVLRSLWACGELLTHHRRAGRHYYDRPERIIPAHYFQATVPDEDTYYRWIMLRRYQAVGLLRPTAESCIWSACGDTEKRKRALQQLLELGELVPVDIGEKRWRYYARPSVLALLDQALPEPRMTFVGPLDSLMWDRKSLRQLFDFDYIWEVYKPESQRRWGYYVLPVFYGDRFVARIDSRLNGTCWTINRWWWEDDVVVDEQHLNALTEGARHFLHYLQAASILVDDTVSAETRLALLKAAR